MNFKSDSAHKRAIAIAKTREDHTCELCSKDTNLHGHHIVDRGFGGSGEPENILVVCKGCHDKIHNGEIVINNYDYRNRP
jgi:5-methylcytosine-specific restriction endonuclease McrA